MKYSEMKIGDYVDSVYSGIGYEVIGLNAGWVKVQCIYHRKRVYNTHAKSLTLHADFFVPGDYAGPNRALGSGQR